MFDNTHDVEYSILRTTFYEMNSVCVVHMIKLYPSYISAALGKISQSLNYFCGYFKYIKEIVIIYMKYYALALHNVPMFQGLAEQLDCPQLIIDLNYFKHIIIISCVDVFNNH